MLRACARQRDDGRVQVRRPRATGDRGERGGGAGDGAGALDCCGPAGAVWGVFPNKDAGVFEEETPTPCPTKDVQMTTTIKNHKMQCQTNLKSKRESQFVILA